MTGWVIAVVDRLGAGGVGLLILLENLVPPVPSEVILPLAGFRASAGGVDPWLVWPAATAGSVLGALLLYGLGAWLGYDRPHTLAGRRWFVLTGRRDLERGRRLFDRHGAKMVLFGRCVPFVRSVISIPAGGGGHAFGPVRRAHRGRQRAVERAVPRPRVGAGGALGPGTELARSDQHGGGDHVGRRAGRGRGAETSEPGNRLRCRPGRAAAAHPKMRGPTSLLPWAI